MCRTEDKFLRGEIPKNKPNIQSHYGIKNIFFEANYARREQKIIPTYRYRLTII